MKPWVEASTSHDPYVVSWRAAKKYGDLFAELDGILSIIQMGSLQRSCDMKDLVSSSSYTLGDHKVTESIESISVLIQNFVLLKIVSLGDSRSCSLR